MGKSTAQGAASAQVTYSDNSTFQPSGLLIDYSGIYTAYFNQSLGLAQNTFSVGFLDSTSYHRGNTATIEATDYQPSQAAVLTVVNNETGVSLMSPISLTASADGIINSTFTIPSSAAVGFYNATITPTGVQKAVQDVETFAEVGYLIQVQTINLANEAVPNIQVQAVDSASGTVYNGTTGSNGMVSFNLDTGSYPLTAFWNNTNVGQTTITVTDNATFTLQCTKLTDLQILVQNENGVPMPFVNLAITYQFQPSNGGSIQTGNASVETGPSGIYTLNSTLTGIKLYSRRFTVRPSF